MVSLAQLVPPPLLAPPAVSLVAAARNPVDTTGGRWALQGITYQPEALAQVAVDDGCGPTGTPLAAVGTPASSTATTGGSLTAATYGYKITALSSWGEGLPSAQKTQVVPSGTSTNTVTLTWTAVAGADRYRVYGRTSGGPWGLLATVSAPTLTYTDTGADTPGSAPPAADTTGVYGYTMPAVVEWQSYSISAYDQCSVQFAGGRDFVGRATRLLENGTPKAVEREFWDGRDAQLRSLPNRWLTKAGSTVVNPTPGTSVSFKRGLNLLEQGLADVGFGAPGIIHCRPETLDDTAQLFRRTGKLILTSRDTVIVPGVGYSGLGPQGNSNEIPAAGKTWMYATGLVDFRATAPDVPAWTGDDAIPADVINRDTNTVTVWARRSALASWDGQVHLAVYVDLPS
jgi:hypothetical protein